MRTATLDLNSRGSFVDDLNFKPGIVMCRDALLHRSHEIQPAFFDSEMKKKVFLDYLFSFFSFVFFFLLPQDPFVACARARAGVRRPPALAFLGGFWGVPKSAGMRARGAAARRRQGQHPEVAQR